MLVPSRRIDRANYDMIRAVQSQNADWYREFCGCHESSRKDRLRWSKFKTSIKRAHTIRALNELIAGECETPYAQMVYSFLENYERKKRDTETEANLRHKAELSVQTRAAFLMRWKQVPV